MGLPWFLVEEFVGTGYWGFFGGFVVVVVVGVATSSVSLVV